MASIRDDRTMVWTVQPGPSTGLEKSCKAQGLELGQSVSLECRLQPVLYWNTCLKRTGTFKQNKTKQTKQQKTDDTKVRFSSLPNGIGRDKAV